MCPHRQNPIACLDCYRAAQERRSNSGPKPRPARPSPPDPLVGLNEEFSQLIRGKTPEEVEQILGVKRRIEEAAALDRRGSAAEERRAAFPGVFREVAHSSPMLPGEILPGR